MKSLKKTHEKVLKNKYKKLFRRVQRVLWRDWDPIGCDVPRDEYDDYVPGVIRLLSENKSAKEISNYLVRIERNEMGLRAVSDEKILNSVSLKLKKIDVDNSFSAINLYEKIEELVRYRHPLVKKGEMSYATSIFYSLLLAPVAMGLFLLLIPNALLNLLKKNK